MLRLLILTSILFFGCNQDKVESNMIKKEGMVLIPSGSFLMGSEEKFSRKDESPKHLVYEILFGLIKMRLLIVNLPDSLKQQVT